MTVKTLIILSCLFLGLQAEDYYGNFSYESELHFESETTVGQKVYIPNVVNKTFKDEHQKLGTFFNILGYKYQSPSMPFSINLEARANIKLSKSDYETPVYIGKYSLDDINQAIISEASVDTYFNNFTLTLGRSNIERLDMDLLSGSVDTIMLHFQNNYISTRAFWIYSYYDFQVNYYAKNEYINHNKGLYGLYLQSGDAIDYVDLNTYYYHTELVYDIIGARLNYYALDTLTFNASYTVGKDLRKYRSFDESYARFWSEYLFDDSNSIDIGVSQTGENPLIAMLQLGSHPFSKFYLGNEIARPKARNYYISYEYLGDNFYIDAIYGQTEYNDDFFYRGKLIKKWFLSKEFDITAEYFINDYLSADLSFMYKDSDNKDYSGFDQQLIITSLKIFYE